jgi:hypothetical protein
MVASLSRPLVGLHVGLSISESEDSEYRGFPPWLVNTVTLQVTEALMGQGAGVVFGHDWRDDGVMQAVHGFALRSQPPEAIPGRPGTAVPLLRNVLPADDRPRLSVEERERLAATLAIEAAGLPDDLLAQRLGAEDEAYVRARALTHLRRQLAERTQARICLGGRTKGYQGRYPGVVEEAFLTVGSGRPLYLAGLLGGASQWVINAIGGARKPVGFASPPPLDLSYRTRGAAAGIDARIDPRNVWSSFRALGVKGLSEANLLTEDENRELFETPAVERTIELALTGLARLRKRTDGDGAQAPIRRRSRRR